MALVLAFAAAGGATAAQVCEPGGGGGGGECPNGPAESLLAKGRSLRASSTDVVLTSTTTPVSCASSSLTVRMTSKNAIPTVEGKVTALSFAGCETGGGTPCVVTLANLPFETVFHLTDVLIFDEAGLDYSVNCGFLISCELEGREQLIELEDGLLVASREIPYAKSGAFCPVAPRLDATYSPQGGVTLLP